MWASLGLLPVFQVSIALLTFFLSYVWAVARNHVSPTFPFISDTGAHRPESSFFSQMLNITAILSFFTMYIRYKYVQLKTNFELTSRWQSRVNLATFVFGVIAAFGVSLVANFQDNSELRVVHFIGACLAFALGVVYCILNTVMTYSLEGKLVFRWRVAITCLCVVVGIAMAASWITAYVVWGSNPHTGKDTRRWKPEDNGYTAHICSTVFEWVLSLSFFAFFLTYVRQFDSIDFDITFRPLTIQDTISAEVAANGHVVNDRARSRSYQSFNSGKSPQGDIETGERARLLGATTDFSGSFSETVST